MKNTELRIGNYVYAGTDIVKVDSINDVGINLSSSGGYYAGDSCMEYEAYFEKGFAYYSNAKVISPIPLTEEILLKCGFDKQIGTPDYDDYSVSYKHKEWGIIEIAFYVSDKIWHIVIDTSHEGGYPVTITSAQFLHTLQNIYYLFTGIELDVKL